jgi:hypothetical protein
LYDCNFSWYCNKCTFTWKTENGYFSSCYHTFLAKLKDNSYGGGRYSNFKDNELECLREYFKNDLKYSSSLYGSYIDIEILLKLYSHPNYKENFYYYRKTVKNVVANLEKYDLLKNYMNYDSFLITREKVCREFEKIYKNTILRNDFYYNENKDDEADEKDNKDEEEEKEVDNNDNLENYIL